MKWKFWTRDGFVVFVIALIFILGNRSDTLQGLERATYDIGVRSAAATPSDRVAIIAIDDQSIENLGRWPWPRDIHARMIDMLQGAGAKVIGLTTLLSEPQTDPGLQEIRALQQFYMDSSLARSSEDDPHTDDLLALSLRMDQAVSALATDQKLAASIANAGNVVMGMQMRPGRPIGRPDQPLPEYVRRNVVPADGGAAGFPQPTVSATPPIPAFGEAADAIGHLVTLLDVDGGVRYEPLLLSYFGDLYPSMSLQIAARSLNLGPQDLATTAEGVRLGNLNIGTDSQLMMNTFFYNDRNGEKAFPVDSFFDVFVGKIDARKYKDRIVLIGATAFGLGTTVKTPLPDAVEPVTVLAHSVSSILNEDFFIMPEWANLLRWALAILVIIYLTVGLPRLGAGLGAALSAVALLALVGTEIILIGTKGTWLPMTMPAALLFTGHLALTTKHFLLTEQGKERSEKESAESNRMLGLAFQQQGQLDMAFEKFRRVPASEDLMELLYNLAMDFERKRQFNKASSVYQHMAKFDPEYRDIQQRSKRANDAQDTIIFGMRSGGSGPGDTLLSADGEGFEKPMLGRYQVEKELGRGAMGIVYQGRDPKINRVVAIKTLNLSEEFEPDELQEVKERFFREAEAAGKLNHPNIVTVYDAGEEHDLAYIAMEFLSGHDLLRYTKPDALMSVPKVLKIVAAAAEALDYAHSQTVVHRDIKPANLMFDPDSSQIKITDFGIARVNNSSRTKTGMVVGTPSYMSPEQVTGKRVDGRSDIFSLGVLLYQMLTGELPFQSETATQIMYKIATEPHPNILETRPGIKRSAPWVSIVLNRAMEKDMDKRYQRGQQMANDIKQVLKKMAAAQARKQSSGDTAG
ncbi:MAG: serine/threonine-protein kinase [Alcanivoracaceae bacterium]|nr:serine/threonine-protein kinase [Alcanivoracaceae bacterium]